MPGLQHTLLHALTPLRGHELLAQFEAPPLVASSGAEDASYRKSKQKNGVISSLSVVVSSHQHFLSVADKDALLRPVSRTAYKVIDD